MELLLVDDVPGLGARGEIVTVARGFARNYLLPKGLATEPNDHMVMVVKRKAVRHAAEMEAQKAEKMEVAGRLAKAHVTLHMKASEEGHLYGSVGPRQVADALEAEGFTLDEKNVALDPHIKDIGDYDVTIALHPEIQVPVKVTVLEEEEA